MSYLPLPKAMPVVDRVMHLFVSPYSWAKEKRMTRIVTVAVGVVAGVIGLLVVQMPREAAEKLRAVAAAAQKRLREAFQLGQQEGEGPPQGVKA